MTKMEGVINSLTEDQQDWYAPGVARVTLAMLLSDAILNDAGYGKPTADQVIALATLIIQERAAQRASNDSDTLIDTLKDMS